MTAFSWMPPTSLGNLQAERAAKLSVRCLSVVPLAILLWTDGFGIERSIHVSKQYFDDTEATTPAPEPHDVRSRASSR